MPFEPFLSRLNWFVSLDDARMIEAWRVDYNSVRPHSSLDYLTPEEFATSAAKRAASPPTPLVPTIPAGVQRSCRKTPMLHYDWANNGGGQVNLKAVALLPSSGSIQHGEVE